MRPSRLLPFAALALAACEGDVMIVVAATQSTSLIGIVIRSPTQPVCRPEISCESPFSALFDVRQGAVPITTFRTADDGRFRLNLPPGDYQIVPAADAPIMTPASQAKTVTVVAEQVTDVRLEFDTGIR
jgi:hypothetical protein